MYMALILISHAISLTLLSILANEISGSHWLIILMQLTADYGGCSQWIFDVAHYGFALPVIMTLCAACFSRNIPIALLVFMVKMTYENVRVPPMHDFVIFTLCIIVLKHLYRCSSLSVCKV